MPFSSTPVYVGAGDQIELRYPTPSTWNTSVTIQVQIGSGLDPTGVTLGTRLPDSQPVAFSFTDNSGSTNSAASLPVDFTSTFQKNTTYYSNAITVTGIDLRVPVSISANASGPKGTYPNLSQSAFSINGGPFITQANSTLTVTGTTVANSRVISVSSTTGLVVGRYLTSSRISGEILSISGTNVTLTNEAVTGGATTFTQYYTVVNNDTIRLRIQTENWYTTNTNVTLTLSDNYWGAGNAVSDTWSITTRAQLQQVTTLNSNTFTDYVDVGVSEFGSYKTQNISISGIDNDVVLRATSTGSGQISLNGTTWSQSLTNIKLGDTLYTRLAIGSTYTTKTTGSFTIFANAGDTATIGASTYEVNGAGTYGSGTYAVTQNLGTSTDNWQVWTEVDRYPNDISLSPIFTNTDTLPLVSVTTGGAGYVNGNTYTTTNITNPSATGLTVKVTAPTGGVVQAVEVVERGQGYSVDDVLRINGGTTLAQIKVQQYRLVNVSTTHTLNNAEVGFTYFANFPISGLGTEYLTGAYSDLESPFAGTSSSTINTSSTSGQTVQIQCNVTQGAGQIRKNNTGSWVQQLYVQNGDTVNFRLTASTSYNTTLTSTVELLGPPQGGPLNNPTGGPSIPSFPNKTDTISIRTRQARTDPYPFRVEHVYNANPGIPVVKTIPIEGLDLNTTAAIVSQTPGSNAQFSLDGSTYNASINVPANTTLLYIRMEAAAAFNTTRTVSYRVGNTVDTFTVKTKQNTYEYEEFVAGNTYFDYVLPQWSETFDFVLVGAGGGNGGDDAPNSFGGRGGFGNVITGTLNIPNSAWPDPLTKTIRVYSPRKGGEGANFAKGAAGGAGGFGYATGGNGGNGASGEYSGGGGGGGGAAAIAFPNGTLIALAGGGGGGGGAGDDTVIQKPSQNGNNGGNGPTQTTLSGLNLTGLNGQSNSTAGGGGGGAGGGWGTGGLTNASLLDEFGGVIATTDLDANGGTGGGIYYNTTYVTVSGTAGNLGAGSFTDGFALIGWPPQDRTPDPFTFTPVVSATPNTEYFSEYVLITGLTGDISVGISTNGLASQVRVCTGNGTGCGTWGNSATIRNGEYVQVRMTTGGNYFTSYTTTVSIGGVDGYFVVNTGDPPDTEPNPFVINSLTNQEISTLVESEIVQVTGINTAVNVIASNGAEIAICNGTVCGAFGPSPRAINNGQSFKLRITTSSLYNTTVNSNVTVGASPSAAWTVTTKTQPDNTPTGFLFNSLTNQNLNTTVNSNTITIQSISDTINFSVTNGATIIKNDVDLGVSTTVAALYDTIRLKYTTSNIVGDDKTFNITAGTYTTTWTVTNAGIFGTSPNPFVFTPNPAIATGPSVSTNSSTVNISGLGTTVGAYATNGARLSKNGGAFNVYTSATPITVTNGDNLRVQLTSSAIAGFTISTDVTVGSFTTPFGVVTPAPTPDPILGQWYSSINMVQTVGSTQYKFATKFDGLPVGSLMPVFQDSTETDRWGNLNGKADSRFPGWIYCDGSYVDLADYRPLYDILGDIYSIQTLSLTATAVANSNQITVPSASGLKVGYKIINQSGTASVNIPANTFITNISGTTLTLSNTITTGGSVGILVVYSFRLPDMRNKKLMGTGPVDGNSTSSPALVPNFGPAKSSSNSSNIVPGSHGGLWYIDQIGIPGIQSIPQVITPGTGLTATESDYFGIGQIVTTGYTDVSGDIEFTTSGQVSGNVGLKKIKLYEPPNHTHLLVTGEADPGALGMIRWGGNGGKSGSIVTDWQSGTYSAGTATADINIWGYALQNLTLGTDDTVRSSKDSTTQWKEGTGDATQWGTTGTPGCAPMDDPGIIGYNVGSSDVYDTVTLLQPNIGLSGSTNNTEINNYIDLNSAPFSGPILGGGVYKFVATVDIPTRTISVAQFNPTTKNDHNHYVSGVAISNINTTFSYGNSNEHGTAVSGAPSNTTVNVIFTASEGAGATTNSTVTVGLGMEVQPGKFTLGSGKQLIPTPELSPQTKVPLITPYTWVRWLIKAY